MTTQRVNYGYVPGDPDGPVLYMSPGDVTGDAFFYVAQPREAASAAIFLEVSKEDLLELHIWMTLGGEESHTLHSIDDTGDRVSFRFEWAFNGGLLVGARNAVAAHRIYLCPADPLVKDIFDVINFGWVRHG